jgi:translation initiation factor 2 alpha subunit (eIF-2alpha)
MKEYPVEIKAEFKLKCTGIDGVNGIKLVLDRALADADLDHQT